MAQASPETEVHFLSDFRNLNPDHAALTNVGLVCFDAENVVVPYGDSLPFVRTRSTVQELHEAGINTCMLTNMTDGLRAEWIAKQLDTTVVFKGCWKDRHDEADYGMPSKTHPDMYQAALASPGLGAHGNRAIMVDDQLKNLKGARKAGFSTFLWTFPNGLRQHLGVALARPIEVPVGFGLIAAQNIRKLKNGTYGEW